MTEHLPLAWFLLLPLPGLLYLLVAGLQHRRERRRCAELAQAWAGREAREHAAYVCAWYVAHPLCWPDEREELKRAA